ncbi:MAG: OmpL47-type beta-barrel domain-containing protein, partial [Cytophagales bacterium]
MNTTTRWFCTLSIFFFCLQNGFSQERPAFELKVIKDPDGTVYWPLALPVYIQLSSQPEGNGAVQLTKVKEDDMKEFGLPLKWDGPGIHYLRHFDKLNTKLLEKEVAYPVHVDGQAPITLLQLQSAPTYFSKKQYFGKGLKGILSASDDMAKVATTQYSINGGAYSEYKSELAFAEEREYQVKFLSADRVGNAEETKSKEFTVDLTAPTTKYAIAIDQLEEKILSPRTLITLTSSDNLAGVKRIVYAFDSSKPIAYLGKISPAALTDGDHILNYSSTDNVQNEELNQTFPFYLDKIAPVITSSIDINYSKVNGITYVAKSSTINLAATDNKAGVKDIFYTVNGIAESKYVSPFKLPQKQGKYSIRYRGVDNVNNRAPFTTDDNLGNMFLDDTPPQLAHEISSPKVFTRDTLFITKDSKITLKSFDYESGSARIDYKIDNATTETYSQSIKLSSDGKHTVAYTGID